MHVLVVGLARTGTAVARCLRSEGHDVTVVEEQPGSGDYRARRDAALAAGARVVEAPDTEAWPGLVADADLVVPSPGVPQHHEAIAVARAAGVEIASELELAAERTGVPIVAVTGTNGKTTVTELTAAMLTASGLRTVAAGNIGRPLIGVSCATPGAQDRETALDVVVVEVSSFQLAFTRSFRPRVAVLLGVAEDHTDWHGSFEAYKAAKARIFANQCDGDLLVYDADDSSACRLAESAPALRVGCSLDATGGRYRLDGEVLMGGADVLARLGDLRRALPHDVRNALAAAAAARHAGATVEGVRAALRAFETLPHRVTLVGESGGVRWYDDSKATNPHAALAAVRSFDRVVLLAGGRNKGLDLGALTAGAGHIASVVAFGEAGVEIEAAFSGVSQVTRVTTMREAVRAAAEVVEPGGVVLLSPGCASFDAYSGYGERGDDFAAEVRALAGSVPWEVR